MIKNKKLLSVALTAALFASTITVPANSLIIANAKSSGGKNTTSYSESSKEQTANKIEKSLKNKFKTSSSRVTFLVKLKDQVDTAKVAKDASAKAKQQGLSSYRTNLLEKSSIVSELKIKADETQRDITTYLDSQMKKGTVSKYQSFFIVNGLSVTGTEDVMNKLAAMPEVQSISENAIIQLNDTKTTSKTSSNTPATGNIEPNIIQISAPQVWAMGYTGTGVTVASVDTGVQWDHPALITKYRGYNASNPSVPNNECNWYDATSAHQATPYDDVGHGTHTMGTMVGSCADGTNQIGVAPGAKWIEAKAFSSQGGESNDIIAAGQWLLAPVDHSGNTHPELAPNIINNSWGSTTAGADDWFRQIVTNWKNAGIFPEFSAGNTSSTNPGGPGSVSVPGAYPESFTTGAVDANNNLASFSLRGPSPYGGILKPDVSAPGVNIRSSVPGNGYDGTYSGTSMAGPCVCGTAALLMQAKSTLTIDQIENIIRNTATSRTDSEYPQSPNNGYGYGVVNAYMAVSSATTGVGHITGQVARRGQDTNPPTFTETPVTQAYKGMPIDITINAQDDVSISAVQLQYIHNAGEQWTTIAAVQNNGDYKGGDFTATIPAAQVTGASLQYRWRIVDYGNNVVFTPTHTITLNNGITDGYFTDFETNPVGWTTSGTSKWQWGTPTGGIGKAASGTKVYATNLAGTYDNNTNTVLEMPPIDLPAGQSYLHFKHWYNVETNFDNCYVKISTDNTNWTTLARYTGNLGTDYTNATLDLSAYASQRVYIQFNMTSDSSVDYNGWFIDDVGLSNQATSSSKIAKKANTSTNAVISSLPVSGRVTILENGASVNTNPADGTYELTQAAGNYTIQAEAYGFYPQTHAIQVTKDQTTEQNFVLDPIPKGVLTGKITNAQSGKPVANAKLYLIEDAAVAPVYTDADGNYSITAYEGSYTLDVMAGDYYSQTASVTITGNHSTTKDIQLRPFVGYSGLISYDGGTADNATAFFKANNAWAVKMTLPDGKDSAILTAGIFKFWDPNWPNPGATAFQAAVFDATGENGLPGRMIAGPYDATAIRDKNQWTTVDLSSYGITVPHDFYVAYIQTTDNPNCPGLCTEKISPYAKRTYQCANGAWKEDPEYGNVMIRAAVSYEAQTPVIATPQDNSYTNNSKITVTGKASTGLDTHVFNNNQEAAVVQPDDSGNFAANVTLQAGANQLKAWSTNSVGHTDYSNLVNITLDTTAPVLNITNPVDGNNTNKEAVTVQGTVTEEHLDSIVVNGVKADVNSDGTWSARIVLSEGTNTITAVATDKAGNSTTKTVNDNAKFGIKPITNLMPDKDVNLNSGNSVKVEFDSEPGLKEAVFTIHVPIAGGKIGKTADAGNSNVEIPMTEVKDQNGNGTGHYVGIWTATSNLTVQGAQIEVKVTDWYGNTLSKYADGKLNVGPEKIKVSRIAGSNRFETSEKLAEAYGNGQKVENIILASGTNFPDALTGSVLTTSLKAPMLLVGSDADNAKAYDYISNNLADNGKVYILGGTGAVSQSVEDYVTNTLNKAVIRISGKDRFETNKMIIDTLAPAKGTPVIIATANDFADALSISSVAAINGYPIVLVNGKHLSDSALSVIDNIQPSSVYVIGGTGAVDENIITEIKNADASLTDTNITRIAGADRYETSLKILNQFKLNNGNLIVATGANFADGLSSSALAAKQFAPILLTNLSALPSQIPTMSKYSNITVVGGYGAVTEDIEILLDGKPVLPE